ncbi:MAG: hypothetical protein A2015_04280 [Spirochaetes bacterium GWF1_31_7]|nr:MAG: hypothetical protein A2Y30_16990 [Spirochaetes bacterium GWE1_32_154]OHD47395.1 MAG: hypothetical protein A2Y29_10000 [Spirochaetes bacterium GWE2_31_10]OHD52938.1 MAG: hypothetical protein A2015_04280 [Spirochaetes bacterium GWF1_31_7]HBD93681.1 hypothetical protein [Spirochaetia bacterium]HBI37185.1 hypothetical protein [Spirochaetia bacterium]
MYTKYLGIIMLFFILSCQPSVYNAIDIYHQIDDLGIEKPVEVYATKGSYKQYIMISWVFYMQLKINFHLYRSEYPDTDFTVISSEIDNSYYFDTTAVPGVTYYYKVKAVSFLNGESDFSETVSALRAGTAIDQFEDGEPENYPEFAIDTTFLRSVYPVDDVDYFLIKCKSKEIKTVSFVPTTNSVANIDTFSIKFYDLKDMNTPIHEVESVKIDKTFKISTPTDVDIVAVLQSDKQGVTGDYNFQIKLLDSEKIIKNLWVSNQYSGYCMIQWDRETFFRSYKIQRRKKGDVDWEFISVSTTIFRRDTVDSISDAGNKAVYDFSIEPDIEYQYRVVGFVTEDFFRYSIDELYGKRNSVEPDSYEPDDSVLTASEFELPVNRQERTMTDDSGVDYMSVTLKAGTSYYIQLNYNQNYAMTVALTIIDMDGKSVFYSPPVENGSIEVNGFQCVTEGRYYVKVECFTRSGAYDISITEKQ